MFYALSALVSITPQNAIEEESKLGRRAHGFGEFVAYRAFMISNVIFSLYPFAELTTGEDGDNFRKRK